MKMAKVCAVSSVAGRLQVGCVILMNDLSLFHGWNGRPSGSDSEICECHDNKTLPDVIHAEDNAIRKVVNSFEVLHTRDSVAFVTHAPCVDCAQKLVDFGISKVYYGESYRCTSGVEVLLKSGVEVVKL